MLRESKKTRGKTHASHRHAPKQEENCAKKLGGYTTPRSGAGSVKGDVRVKDVIRVENKCTTNKESFRITRLMAEKIENAALQSGELPAIELEFVDDKGKILHKLVIVPEYVLQSIVEVESNV